MQMAISRAWPIFSILFVLCSATVWSQIDVVASFSDIEARLNNIPEKNGQVVITIESFSGKNAKRISQLADRVEIWLGSKRIASMDSSAREVVDEGRRRLFPFPPIEMKPGYYFLTARLFRKGTLSARHKWKGETFQVGIHPGQISRVHKIVPFFVW
ncbi:MAG: hypothetical protein Kow0029_27500 [Candidatus Rifleibacteriota bacterium]